MGQPNMDQILKEDAMNDSIDKSNKEYILRNWKTLKQSIAPVYLVRELESCKFLPKSSFENLGSKSHSHQATLVLIKVYRQIQLYQKKYQKFVEILLRHPATAAAAEVLNNYFGGPINKAETVDKLLIEQTKDLLKRYGKNIKDKLKKNLDVVLEITDNFIECGLLDIDKLEELLHSPKKSAQRLVDFVIANIHLGAYNHLLETLKSEKRCRGLVSELATAVDREDANTAKPILQEIRKDSTDVTRETASGGFEFLLNTKPEIPNMYSSLLAEHSPADLTVFKNFGSTIEKKKEGSAKFRFAYAYSKNVSAVKDKILEGTMTHMVEDILKHTNDTDLNALSQLGVKLKCYTINESNMSTENLTADALTQVEPLTKELVEHINENIIAANRSFLIEEIDTMVLVKAFHDKGIHCFDGLDGTLGRQQGAEHFLTILERNNLLDQLLDILHDHGMTYVLDRLNNCRNAYSADPEILRLHISTNRTNILDSLDIDDVREIFIERNVFSSRMFDEIEKEYSGSEDQMCFVLIEIKNAGPRAMRTLVDVLYINELDSLADSLRSGTPYELQEMQDNTQTDESSSESDLLYDASFEVSKSDDESSSKGKLLCEASYVESTSDDESSSDGELLYEATFILSKADEKPPSDA